jgi:hypothetical protein
MLCFLWPYKDIEKHHFAGKMNIQALASPYAAYAGYANNFKATGMINVMQAHPEVPLAVAALYVAFVFAGQAAMKRCDAPPLRWVNVVWNLFLSLFSIAGAVVTIPYLAQKLQAEGFYYTMCEQPDNWFFNGPTGLWVGLFALSKIPEMFDTVLLVLQKKPVILLHWYHHFTVMLFCWFAWCNYVAPGIWYAAMNYGVHSIMYTYYFLMSLSAATRKVAKPFAQMITTVQLLQMVAGSAIAVMGAFYIHVSRTPCAQGGALLNGLAIAMYASYFVLFAMLFNRNYLKKKK